MKNNSSDENDKIILQKPNKYYQYIPFYSSIECERNRLFENILQHLSENIQLSEFEPQFTYWSNQLQTYTSHYGYSFTKEQHLQLIHFYFSILSIDNLNYTSVDTCFNRISNLLYKKKLIKQDELTIDWRIFYKWYLKIHDNNDQKYGLANPSYLVECSLKICLKYSKYYFLPIATQEILDEFRAKLCSSEFLNLFHNINILQNFLPIHRTDQTYKLWFDEFFHLWQESSNALLWENLLLILFSTMAWEHTDEIDWEPMLPKIFTRFLRGFSVPFGETQSTSDIVGYFIFDYPAKWIIAMITNENSCLEYLKDLLKAMKIFFYPSNTGQFQENLFEFIMNLAKFFLERIQSDEQPSTLSDETITNFVNCIKDYAFISIFNKTYSQQAIDTCYYLSILRSNLILPTIIDSLFSSVDQLCEPHRFSSIMNCLIRLTNQIVQENIPILPILIAILPGIDLNDLNKTKLVLEFYSSIFHLISCTIEYQDFVVNFLNRIFYIIEIFSADMSNENVTTSIDRYIIQFIHQLVRQSDKQIFDIIQKKILDYLSHPFLSPKIRRLTSRLIQKLVQIHPEEIFKNLLSQISNAFNINNNQNDLELTWYATLFSNILRTRGDILINFKQEILSIFHQCIHIETRDVYQALAYGLNTLLHSLITIYPFDYNNCQFHIPNQDEINFAWQILDEFLDFEINSINKIKQRKSLTIIHQITLACSKTKYQYLEQIRMKIFLSISKYLDTKDNDIECIKIALRIYSLLSINQNTTNIFIDKLSQEIRENKQLFKIKKLIKPNFIHVKQIYLQYKKVQYGFQRQMTDMDRDILLKFFDFSLHRYSEIRIQAQNELFSILKYFPYSYKIILDRFIQLLNRSIQLDYYQIKGCLYILIGNDSFCLSTLSSWILLEKLWPAIAMLHLGNQLTTQKLMDKLHSKILENFSLNTLIEHANESAIIAAETISKSIIQCENHHKQNIRSYYNLMNTLHLLIKQEILTRKQQKIILSFLHLLLQRDLPIPSFCIQIFMNFLLHDHVEVRNYAEKALVAIGRLQKPIRYFIENKDISIADYYLPKTQIEWENTCFFDKIYLGFYAWPKTMQCSLNKRIRYTIETMSEGVAIVYDRFSDKEFIDKYLQLAILDETNFNKTRFNIIKSLFRNYGLIFFENFLEQIYRLIREKTIDKEKQSHTLASIITAGMIRGSKHWTLKMLDEFWTKLLPFLTEVCLNLNIETCNSWYTCFRQCMENIDPRRMYRLIDFLRTFHHNHKTTKTFDETIRWNLVSILNVFQWKIPSIWKEINQELKHLLDDSSQSIRNSVINILSKSLSYNYNLTYSNQKMNANDCFNEIFSKLEESIEICDKFHLVNFTGDEIEMDFEVRKALNFIESVISILQLYWFWSGQPMNDSIVYLIPSLCEMDTVVGCSSVLKDSLKRIRTKISKTYFHVDHMKIIINKLEKFYDITTKWQTRRAIIDFIQNMIFSNLFTARIFTKQLHEFIRRCLFDEQIEVRLTASTTLRGFYQCGFFRNIENDLVNYCEISQITLENNVIRKHAGILGICAIILSSPYDIPKYLPVALMFICEHAYDHNLIQKSVENCLSEFRRTHCDGWHEHQKYFNNNQLSRLNDMFVAHNYYV